jgi:hypothetical protein
MNQSGLAQGAPVVAPGSFVRVAHTALCCRSPLTGTLVSVDTDSLRIWPGRPGSAKTVAIVPRTAITSIEIGQHVGEHKAVGALDGSVIGALTGGLIGYATACAHCDGDWRPFGALVVGGGGAIVGLFVGTAIGATRPHYEWTPARLAGGEHARFAVTVGRAGPARITLGTRASLTLPGAPVTRQRHVGLEGR